MLIIYKWKMSLKIIFVWPQNELCQQKMLFIPCFSDLSERVWLIIWGRDQNCALRRNFSKNIYFVFKKWQYTMNILATTRMFLLSYMTLACCAACPALAVISCTPCSLPESHKSYLDNAAVLWHVIQCDTYAKQVSLLPRWRVTVTYKNTVQ